MTSRPRLAVTLGDPGGIGPEITARALATPGLLDLCDPVIYGHSGAWSRGCQVAGVAMDSLGTFVSVDDAPLESLPYGKGDALAGRVQFRALVRAVDDVLAGHCEALCTAPVNKAAVHLVEPGFAGHTEYLQERFAVPRVVMLMAGDRLRVALATTHVALSEVSKRLTISDLVETTLLTARELESRFGLKSPRIAMLGVNPHAGEEGRFGDEEIRIVTPAIAELRRLGVRVEGPFAADGLFPRVLESGFDAVVAMYHDQGLIPFKMLEFHTGVNVTLGLPRPRTSPDHGVAYDIAGTGRADARSMLSALRLALRLLRR